VRSSSVCCRSVAHGYDGRLLVVAGRQGSRLPDPGGQQDHCYREWQHVQDDDGPGGYRLLSDFQADEEQDRRGTRGA
jgi:hypothetical protein